MGLFWCLVFREVEASFNDNDENDLPRGKIQGRKTTQIFGRRESAWQAKSRSDPLLSFNRSNLLLSERDSRMSCLAIYRPQVVEQIEEPAILKFPRLRIAPHTQTAPEPAVVRRAKLLHLNSCCPDCKSVAVDPIELNDAMLNIQRRPIPGTATVVAFHCNRCFHEWPAR